jgi:small subunit ribosomal protein S20
MAKLKTGRHTSAIKTQRMAVRRTRLNRGLKKAARDSAKSLIVVATSKDKEKTQTIFRKACSTWDKAAKKGAIHWKTAARKKSRLAHNAAKLLVAQPPAEKKPQPSQA